jgi:hypothetical protein
MLSVMKHQTIEAFLMDMPGAATRLVQVAGLLKVGFFSVFFLLMLKIVFFCLASLLWINAIMAT